MEMELNFGRGNYYSTQMKVHQIEENIHRMSGELVELQEERRQNRRAIDEQNNQLNQFRFYRQDVSIAADDDHSLKQQVDKEEKMILTLKEQKKELNDQLFEQLTLVKIHEHERRKLNKTWKTLLDKIQFKQEESESEKRTKHELFRMTRQFRKDLKQKQKILSINHRQVHQYQVEKTELEHQRNFLQKQSVIPPSVQSLDHLKASIHQQFNDRLKLTVHHHDLEDQIRSLHSTTHEYASLVKDQRAKIFTYEKLHDKWIVNIRVNRKRLLDSFNRAHTLAQHINKSKEFLEHFDRFQLSFEPKILMVYHQFNVFLEQRFDFFDDFNQISPL